MNESKEENTPSADTQSSLGVPIAIVIAGALIASAIYFGNNPSPSAVTVADNTDTAKEQQPVPQNNSGAIVVGDFKPVDGSDHIRGPVNAKVTIIEYSDIECPFCQRFHPTMTRLLVEHPNDVRWVWRHFPLEQLHPNARGAALAAECANDQGKFWTMIDYMMTKVADDAGLAPDNLPKIAQAVGVPNIAQFSQCLSDKKYNQKIDEHISDATSAGGRGTPYSIIIGPNGTKEPISGAQPYEVVKAAVEKYL